MRKLVFVTSDRPSSPMPPIDSVTQVGIAGEQLVVLRRAQEADDAQLDDEVVDDLLRLLLGERARREIALEVDVEERRGAAERHRRAVLFLHAGEVAEVQPLHRFPGVRAGPEMSKP